MNIKEFLLLFLIIAFFVFLSCRKDAPYDDPIAVNKPPIAHAGNDTIIVLPLDSVALNGSTSYDPDGDIRDFLWSKIAGPSSFAIVNPKSASTYLKHLTAGVYEFELKVSDNEGSIVTDTVSITADEVVPNNRPPVAIAGLDQTIALPINSVILDGSMSHDADNNITTYQWSKISGPTSSYISNPNDIQTPVTLLVEGVYQFQVKVRDAAGLAAMDTVKVTVTSTDPPVNVLCDPRQDINARLVPIGSLSEGRIGLVSASVNNKILFAGGMVTGAYSSRVDIYDIVTNTWSTAELTRPERQGMTVATVGNKVMFAGGGDNDNGSTTTRVDIYDASNNTWSTAELSQGREYFAAATLGNKVFFAGGRTWETSPSGFSTWATSNVVDIFDNSTSTWTTATLSESRSDLSATAIGNKIYFAGGFLGQFQQFPSKALDIFDATTNSWSTSRLLEEKAAHSDISAGNKIFWAGGIFSNNGLGPWPSNHVEIRDISTGLTSFACLIPKVGARAVIKGDDIIFFQGNMDNGMVSGTEFDIYNIPSGRWATAHLDKEIYDATIISVDNTVYVAGGRDQAWGTYFNNVWKLEF